MVVYCVLGVFGLLLLIGSAGIFIIRYTEKKDWNNGICSICNTKWECLTKDTHGNKQYKCTCDQFHTLWTTYRENGN